MTRLSHLAFVFGFLNAMMAFVTSLAGLSGLVNLGTATTSSHWLMGASTVSLILFLFSLFLTV